jgi:nitrite reductase/ring-hydroxylating ferredoxin subunit
LLLFIFSHQCSFLANIEEMGDNSLCVRCPWHSWRFDLNTGKVNMPKGQNLRVKVYPVIVAENGQLSSTQSNGIQRKKNTHYKKLDEK